MTSQCVTPVSNTSWIVENETSGKQNVYRRIFWLLVLNFFFVSSEERSAGAPVWETLNLWNYKFRSMLPYAIKKIYFRLVYDMFPGLWELLKRGICRAFSGFLAITSLHATMQQMHLRSTHITIRIWCLFHVQSYPTTLDLVVDTARFSSLVRAFAWP